MPNAEKKSISTTPCVARFAGATTAPNAPNIWSCAIATAIWPIIIKRTRKSASKIKKQSFPLYKRSNDYTFPLKMPNGGSALLLRRALRALETKSRPQSNAHREMRLYIRLFFEGIFAQNRRIFLKNFICFYICVYLGRIFTVPKYRSATVPASFSSICTSERQTQCRRSRRPCRSKYRLPPSLTRTSGTARHRYSCRKTRTHTA